MPLKVLLAFSLLLTGGTGFAGDDASRTQVFYSVLDDPKKCGRALGGILQKMVERKLVRYGNGMKNCFDAFYRNEKTFEELRELALHEIDPDGSWRNKNSDSDFGFAFSNMVTAVGFSKDFFRTPELEEPQTIDSFNDATCEYLASRFKFDEALQDIVADNFLEFLAEVTERIRVFGFWRTLRNLAGPVSYVTEAYSLFSNSPMLILGTKIRNNVLIEEERGEVFDRKQFWMDQLDVASKSWYTIYADEKRQCYATARDYLATTEIEQGETLDVPFIADDE